MRDHQRKATNMKSSTCNPSRNALHVSVANGRCACALSAVATQCPVDIVECLVRPSVVQAARLVLANNVFTPYSLFFILVSAANSQHKIATRSSQHEIATRSSQHEIVNT